MSLLVLRLLVSKELMKQTLVRFFVKLGKPLFEISFDAASRLYVKDWDAPVNESREMMSHTVRTRGGAR
jgi:hypothetical protein